MPRLLGCLTAIVAFFPAVGWADPLRSPACLAALDALTLAEEAASRRPPSPDAGRREEPAPASVPAARRAAAAACLGTVDTARPAARLLVPAAIERVPRPALQPDAARPPAPMPAPVRQKPPHMITVCDADGCWTNEGLRLQRQGSLLQGPRGPCLQVGAVLNCP